MNRTLLAALLLGSTLAWGQMGPSGGGGGTPTGTASGDLAGTFPSPTVAKVNGTTMTAPASGLLVGTTDSQTLTNKTLTSPAITSGTNTTLNHSDVEIVSGCMDFQIPTTGGTINVAAGICEEMIAPTGTLATLTTNLIAAPVNGQKLKLRFTQIITGLTVGGGGANSVVGNPVTAALGATIDCVYRTSNTTWYC